MKWFGEDWGAPCCTSEDFVPTPVGEPCSGSRCKKTIAKDDRGFLLPFMSAEGGPTWIAYHHACLVAEVLPCPGCPRCRPGDPRTSPLSAIFAKGLEAAWVPGGTGDAVAAAIRIQSDPTNRAVTCSCGVTFLTGAAQRDAEGRPLCFGCGEPVV